MTCGSYSLSFGPAPLHPAAAMTYRHFPLRGDVTYIGKREGNATAMETGIVNDASSQKLVPMGGELGGRICGAFNEMRPRQRRAPVECGDLPFLIRRDGTWLYCGSPIGRKELVCLFASVLR